MSESRQPDPFAELYGDFADRLQGDHWSPDVDVFETAEQVFIRVELAGIASDDLRVTLDGSAVRVSGVRNGQPAEGIERLHQVEVASGPFDRRIHVPVSFEKDRVTAHLANGFLTVTLEKRAPRQIAIESASGGAVGDE